MGSPEAWVEARAHEALDVIDARGESTIVEIAEACGVSRSTVTLWVSLLYRRGVLQRTREPTPKKKEQALWSRRGTVPARGDCVVIYDPRDRLGVAPTTPRQQCYRCPYRHVVEDIEDCRYRSDAIECCDLDLANRGALTLEEVGNRLGVTRERIRQIERSALLKLRDRCAEHPDVWRELMAAIEEREASEAASEAASIWSHGEPPESRPPVKKPVVGVDEKKIKNRARLLRQSKVERALRAVENSTTGLTADEIADSVGMSVSWAYTMIIEPFLEVAGRGKGGKGWTTRRWKRDV